MGQSTILLVDDDEDDQCIFIDLIRDIRQEVQCFTADDGLQALEKLRDLVPAPGLIFLDLNMPFINGFECLERIRQDNRLKTIPVVIFTTSQSDSDRKKAKDNGADLFLSKTADLRSLRDSLRNILDRYMGAS
jgi:CheY-like chemotaxis protein